jgi:hypothetical protein
MQAHELADLAALVAVHGEQLVANDAATMEASLAAYWKASRCRLDRWGRGLAALTRDTTQDGWVDEDIAAVQEILVSEILSRVVTAIAAAHDMGHAVSESAPVARNIFNAHIDLKRRAVAVVVAPHRDQEFAHDFLALRRQCDRWIDLLMAYLAPLVPVAEFATDVARVGDFAFDAREHLRSGASSDMAVAMIVAGMRSSLLRLSSAASPNEDLNLEIATSVVGIFKPDFFDAHGHLRSPWLDRICKASADSSVASDVWRHQTPHGPHDGPRPARWRR